MSMKVGNYGRDYKDDYLERLQKEQEKDKVSMAYRQQNVDDRNKFTRDEYISSKETENKPSGLYRIERNQDGSPKILYDDPKKTAKDIPSAKGAEEQEKKCTGSTDKVDREIEKLKEKKKQIQQEITAARGDEKKIRELKRELSQVEGELNQKDNDAYRRQNTVFS